jgi:two-component system cell cycle sensor histidine kinase/response regulator CckA
MGNQPRIMIVDDEHVVVLDLKHRLTNLGYHVCATASTAAEAIRNACETQPDLVLMDIRLKGDIDGIQAAEQIRSSLNVPVVFLTAYADDNTLQRAKVTEPYGYLLKPFEERELQITIEIALYRHTAERQLRRSEQLLATTLRSISEAVITTDANGLITYMNPLAEALMQQPFSALEGKPVTEVIRLSDSDGLAACECPVAVALRTGQPTGWSSHRLWMGQDCPPLPIDDSASPIRDDAGNVIGAVLLFRDVSDRLQAEAERRQLEEQYHHAQKMEAVGRLTGGIAHEFNNLLTVMNGYSEILMQEIPEGTRAHRMISLIHRSGWQAADLVRHLLAFSRRQTLSPRILQINAVIENMRDTWSRLIGEDVTVETRLASDLWLVEADPAQIELTLINLIVNARDAMPDGGHLCIETANVMVPAGQPDNAWNGTAEAYVLLAVSDTGVGMTDDIRARIFEPFFTTKEPGRGTGLGLAAVHGFITQSGGFVRCESQPRKGTRLSIYLPRAIPASEVSETEPHSDTLPAGRETILLVEDEAAVRHLAREVLVARGYTVLTAEDGRQALQIAATHSGNIDLLVTDMAMPGMSGTMLAHQIVKKRPTTKVLFISGHPLQHIDADDSVGISATLLQKPFTCRLLARTVREVLDGSDRQHLGTFEIIRS